jgi:hypothetical protein
VKPSFVFKGKTTAASAYGSDYISEFSRILDTRLPGPPARILEWGSGLTSLVLVEKAKRWGTTLFLTMDNNREYQEAVFAGIDRPDFLQYISLDQQGPTRGQADEGLNYSTFPLSLGEPFDLIFIDGRRRMECAYMAALMAHENTLVVLHDFRRRRYQAILGLFERVEDGPQFRVLRLRRDLVEPLGRGRQAALAALAEPPPPPRRDA